MPILKPIRGSQLIRSHPLARGLVGCWLMNEGAGTTVQDLSGNGNTGSLVADTHFVPGKFGSALDFDGTGDYVDLGTPTSLTALTYPITISAWIKPSTLSQNAVMISLDVTDASSDITIGLYSGDNEILAGNLAHKYGLSGISSYLTANIWQYWTLVFNTTTDIKLYLDGNEKTLSDVGSYFSAKKNNIGARENGTQYPFNGQIDHVIIYNHALSASEIARLYREPFCMFERAWRPRLIGGQIVELVGTFAALSSLSAAAKATRKVGGTVASTSDVAAVLNSIRGLAASTRGLAAVDGSLGIGIMAESSLEVERSWIREALFNGVTSNAFKLGTTLSLGWFWVRIAGCSVLYRGSSMGEIDFVNILAVAEQDACEISPPNYISHNSGSTYFYVVRRFNNCGYQERTLAAAVRVSIESNGELAEPQPNKVFDSGAEHADGNKIWFVWFYCPIEQKSQPVCFNIYYDGRTGQIDYENPLATIGYKGRKFYSFQSSTLEAGKYLFAIRAEDVSGIENSSLARLRIQLDTASPDAVDIIRAEAV